MGSPPERNRLAIVPFLRECCLLSMSGSASSWGIDEPADGPAWDVFADANQLSQVVANILVNARQAMADAGHVRIRVRNRVFEKGDESDLAAGRYVQIAIQDEGPGIPSQALPRVFEPFFTTKPAGSGLGLAMSYSIVHAHRGRITATSMPGGGAEITVWLPAAAHDARVRTVQVAAALPEQARSGRIVLMDDEPLVRDMAARMLTRGGYEVAQARDGQEVITLCREALAAGTPFSAAILDVTVPGGMGGAEALRRLRELQPELAVVLSSGYGSLTAVTDDCQPTAVLPKPYQMHELLACARAVTNPPPRPPTSLT